MEDTGKGKSKKAYEKPALRIIELAAEEVLVVSCKTNFGPGPSGFNCAVRRCSGLGS